MMIRLSLSLLALLMTVPANACDLHHNPSAAEATEDQESSATVKEKAVKAVKAVKAAKSPAVDQKISPQKKKKSAPAKPNTTT